MALTPCSPAPHLSCSICVAVNISALTFHRACFALSLCSPAPTCSSMGMMGAPLSVFMSMPGGGDRGTGQGGELGKAGRAELGQGAVGQGTALSPGLIALEFGARNKLYAPGQQ